MAENEAMEGKDLALKEKQEFEEKVLESIKDLKTGETSLSIGGIEITSYGEQYTMKLKGITFAIIGSDGKITYNRENFAEVKKALEEEGLTLEQLGLPDIEEWIDEQEKQQREGEEIGEQEKDEKDLSKKKEEEKPEEEEEIEDETKTEIARRYRVSPNQVIHISTSGRSKRVTDKDHFAGLAKWAEKYDDIFILPGEDEYSWQTIGINKDGEEETIDNRQIEGKNPNVTIKMVDGKEITQIRPIAMYEIDNKQSYAIVRDSAGKTQMVYCRQEEGRGKEYWGIGVPEASGKNVREKAVEGREFMDSRNTSSYDLSKKADSLETATDLESRGIPSRRGSGVQVEEIEGTAVQNREMRKQDIIEDLLKRDGIIDRAKAMPGFYENKAEKVLRLMESNDKITYEQAVESVERGNRDQGGRTPDENPRNRRQH